MHKFINLADDAECQRLAADMLYRAFIEKGLDSWPTLASAQHEVRACLRSPNLCLGLKLEGELLGWAGLQPKYETTWELHPLVVDPERQHRGLGRKLLTEIERQAKAQGVTGVLLGTDDESYRTSLSQVKHLGANLPDEIRNIRNLNQHPFTFYQKCGYIVVGVVPDANGPNKPDILMWKSLIQPSFDGSKTNN